MILGENPETLHRPVGCYSQAVRSGDLVVTSGQAALDVDGRVVAPGDPGGQTRQTVRNMESALAAHGAGLADVMRVTVYLTDYAHYPAMDAAFREFFGAHPPARATLRCPLIQPELLVEMDAWARLPHATTQDGAAQDGAAQDGA
jgi:enamine deaminase RidA (YjgF/YER057c/UK114 family)